MIRQRWRVAGVQLLSLISAGCIASNVVAPEQRLVANSLAELQFTRASGDALEGFWESVDIQGDAAQSLRRTWYVFHDGGVYTAAALIATGGQFTFQALSGTWAIVAAGLSLDGQSPVCLEQAAGHIRLSSSTGTLVLRRGSLD